MKIGIIGAGAWGATLAQVLVDNNHQVVVYDNNKQNIEKINMQQHPFFDCEISSEIKTVDTIKEITDQTDYVLLAVPTKAIRTILEEINKNLNRKTVFICVSKGIEPKTGLRMSEIVKEIVKEEYYGGYVVLTGPSHAEEVILRKLTLLTVASEDEKLAKKLQKVFSNENYLRVYTTTDVIGAEVGGATKNGIAIVSGIITGLDLGENARAALITRGILEIARVVEFYGGTKDTAFGLTGVGDLIVTASSEHSRNFRAGKKIGLGKTIEEIYAEEPQTIEGVRVIEALHDISVKNNIYLPIINAAYEVIFEKVPIKEAIAKILSAKLKEEKIE